MIAIDDKHLPGLANLTQENLRRITGAEELSLMRFRYRAGSRAILHLDTGGRQGSVWFFRGDKARRLARRNKRHARYDAATKALFEAFPNDHRMPQIRAFLDEYTVVAPRLLGGRPIGAPKVLRYRPGLSCTFRCSIAGDVTGFVKLINDDSPARLAMMNKHMAELLSGGPVSVAPVIATNTVLSAIGYARAPGRSLDEELAIAGTLDPVCQTIDALRRFWRLPLTPVRHLTAEALFQRGVESVELTGVTLPEARTSVEAVLARLDAAAPRLGCRPIHADMKLEHVFLDGANTTFIDTESVSLGPPDYDLAQIYGRLWQAELEGQLARNTVEKAAREVKAAAGAGFDWCLDVVALRLAKFYAQRPSLDAAEKIEAMLERLS